MQEQVQNNKIEKWQKMANAIRALTIDAVEEANSGHPGMPMGMADVATIIYDGFLKFDPNFPKWPGRDRFILSAGHGSMLQYAILYLLEIRSSNGELEINLQDLKNFRQLNSKTAGHPEYGEIESIETTTGPLGQGLANAVGMAISLKKQELDNKVYVVVGDGCLMEGISHEACSFAGHLALDNLIVIFDNNGISIDGSTKLTCSENIKKRFEAQNWQVLEIDGHNHLQIEQALEMSQSSNKPTLISCKTVIGFGSPNKSGTEKCHGAALGKEEAALSKKELGYDKIAKFAIEPEAKEAWQSLREKHVKSSHNFENSKTNNSEIHLQKIIIQAKQQASENPKATRQSFGEITEKICQINPQIIGGSADLSGSNVTINSQSKIISATDFSGNYLHYGVREHAMAAIMNGMALSGYVPYGGSFLVFSDYCRPAIRLSALMNLRVIYVMTHDSIGVGEDGPTHQPIEHLAALRAIPNLQVIRPADEIEAIEAAEIAFTSNGPSVIILSRQKLPKIREFSEDNKLFLGAYEIFRNNVLSEEKVCIFATGSEVEIAIKSAENLENSNICASVISIPCVEIFKNQSLTKQQEFLNKFKHRFAIEAGISMGWDEFITERDNFMGLNSFGASAKASDLYEYFGLTAEKLTNLIKQKLGEIN